MWMWAALIAGGMVLVSLYTGPWMWISLGAMSALTVLMTFVLPGCASPRCSTARPVKMTREATP